MNVLSTTLKMVCCPLPVHDLAKAKKDECIQNAIINAQLYMIAKKPLVYFSNVNVDNKKIDLDLVNAYDRVSISIPLDQPIFKPDGEKTFVFDVRSADNSSFVENYPVENACEIYVYAIENALYEKLTEKKFNEKKLRKLLNADSFVVRLTPEKLLFLYLDNRLRIPNFDKAQKNFWDFEVMFIDKIPAPCMADGCCNYESFMKVIQSEIDEYESDLEDTVLLFFNAQECDRSLLIANDTSFNDFQKRLNPKKMPSVDLLSLKTEVFFIDKFKPKCDEMQFHEYFERKGCSGISEYDVIDYAINDSINLVLRDMKWFGGLNGNCLVYCKNSQLSVMNPADFNDLLERKFLESVLSY